MCGGGGGGGGGALTRWGWVLKHPYNFLIMSLDSPSLVLTFVLCQYVQSPHYIVFYIS